MFTALNKWLFGNSELASRLMPIDTRVRIVPSVTQLKTLHRLPITPCHLFDKWDLFWWSVCGSTRAYTCCPRHRNEPSASIIINCPYSPGGFQTSETNGSYVKRDVFYGCLHWGLTCEFVKPYEHFWEVGNPQHPTILVSSQPIKDGGRWVGGVSPAAEWNLNVIGWFYHKRVNEQKRPRKTDK